MSQASKKSYYAVAVIVVIIIAALAIYIVVQNNKVKYGGEIKLGATVSLSGKYATEGQRVLNGYQMAIDKINKEGGVVIGGQKYNLTLKYYDDASDKTTAAQLYDKLISTDKVNILMGPYSSSIVLSVAPVAEAAKIPFIQAGGASDSIYKQNFTYVFGLYRVGSTYSQPLFEWLNTSSHVSDISSVGVFIEDSAFPLSVWSGAEQYINNAGLNLVKSYTYTDLDEVSTDMADLKSQGGADLILTIGHYADSKKVVEEVKANGLTPKAIFGTVGVPEEKFVNELGDNAEHVMGFAQWVTNLPESEAPGITQFVQDYTTRYNETPAYHAAGGYSAIYVVKEAVEKAGTFTDGTAVRDALKNLDFSTVWGHISFKSTGVIGGSAYMVQIQNGNIETVYPDSYKTKDPIFPM